MPSKNLLTRLSRRRYSECVAETTATGFCSPNNRSAQPRIAAFLCVSPSCAYFYGRALVGELKSSPVPSVAGLQTSPCARSPHFAVDSGPSIKPKELAMRANTPARPEQSPLPQNLTSFINGALRSAALAPTYVDALDIAGAALRAVADIARADALHPGDSIRSTYAGRTGTVVKVYPDGSAAVRWDDGSPQPEGLAHERMPRSLLEVRHA